MLSRLCFSQFNRVQPVSLSNVRKLTLSMLNGARTGGLRGSSFTEQFAFRARTVGAQSLRERLLGPTTGKPFIYGTYAVAGASVFGIGMLCYYGLGMSKEINAVDRSAVWPEYVRHRLQQTYGYLAGGVALTAMAGIAGARSPLVMSIASRGSLLAMVGWIAAMVGTSALTRSIPYKSKLLKHSAWALHCGIMGAMLAPLCMLGGPAVLRAAWYTAGIAAGLSVTAMCAPSEKFLAMGGPLAMGLAVVFAANIGSFFFPPHSALGASLASLVVYGGLILFSGMLLYHTQQIIRHAENLPSGGYQTFYNQYGQPFQTKTDYYDPINAQMSLYADILNIFIRLAMIFGGGNNRKK